MRYKSTFDYSLFVNSEGIYYFAISKERYSLKKATEIMKKEAELENYILKTMYIKYGIYFDENEVKSGWTISDKEENGDCECYVFIDS